MAAIKGQMRHNLQITDIKVKTKDLSAQKSSAVELKR